MWKLIENKGGKLCSKGSQVVKKALAGGGRTGFQGPVCGLKFATDKPTEYMAAVKKNKDALNAFKAAATGKSTSKILNAARWVMRDTMNPIGWIGGELIISGGITAAMLGEGYTTRESIDTGLGWFLPKSVLKAELHKIRDLAEKEGVDFETLMPIIELENIAAEHEKYQTQHEKLTNPLAAWAPEQLEYFSSKWFGKPTRELSQEENVHGATEVKQFIERLKMPMPSGGYRGRADRPGQINMAQAGIDATNKKYSDLLEKIQKPFKEGDYGWALPGTQLHELRNIADMAQTERAKANELANLKSMYNKGMQRMQYTAGRGKPQTFEQFVHKQGKGDLFFNEFQRGPDRREMLTWGLFHDVGTEPYKMKFPGEVSPERIAEAQQEQFDINQPIFESGGRVGLKKGKTPPFSLSRRGFLKWFAGITGATVAAGTGLIKFGKVTGTGKTVIRAGDHIIQGTEGMPSWFIPLVNRIVKEGDNVTKKLSTIEREIVHTKKIGKGEEVTVYQDMNTGNVRIEYGPPVLNKQGKVIRASNDLETVHLEYKAPEVIEEGKHAGKKTKSEFSAAESEPRVVNWEGDIEWEHLRDVNKVDDLVTDTSRLKEFGTKKKLTIKDKVKSKKKQKYQKKLQEDPTEQLEYIEKKEGMTIDDLIDEEARIVGEIGNPDTKGMNLLDKTKKTKKASGGLIDDYDTYLPDIDDLD